MRKSETNYANTTASVKSDAEGTASENDPRLGRLHERLKVAIGERSTRAVADESGISEGTVRNLLNGGIPKLDSLLRIADATGVDVGWLATGEGPMRPVEGRRAEHGREDAPPSPGAECQLQACEAAQIQAGFLGDQIGAKSAKGSRVSGAVEGHGLACSHRVGM